jgi:hypothetical protein
VSKAVLNHKSRANGHCNTGVDSYFFLLGGTNGSISKSRVKNKNTFQKLVKSLSIIRTGRIYVTKALYRNRLKCIVNN